jgi:outer membrane protein TolC
LAKPSDQQLKPKWWEEFGDEDLSLEERALKSSPEFKNCLRKS